MTTGTIRTIELLVVQVAGTIAMIIVCLKVIIELFVNAKRHEESAEALDRRIKTSLREHPL